jgi:transcriptional regulator with XRE-family HTH domain
MNTTRPVASRQRLVAERLRRHWTQLEVADQLGTTPGNVSRWERGITSPGPYFRSRLCEVYGRSARELGLTWDESDENLSLYAKASALAASLRRDAPARGSSSFADRVDLPALLRSQNRSDTTTALHSLLVNGGQGVMNPADQENIDQNWLAQAVAQYLQKLLLEDMGAVVLVVLNSSGGPRPTSLQKSLNHRQTPRSEDCCDEYALLRGNFRRRQGA